MLGNLLNSQIMEQYNHITMHKLCDLKSLTLQEYFFEKILGGLKSNQKLGKKTLNIAHKMWVVNSFFVIGISRFLKKILDSL